MKNLVEASSEIKTVQLWIGGKSVTPHSMRTGPVMNPATGKVIRHAPMADDVDVDAAVQAAQKALPLWRETPPLRRARVMQKFLALLQGSTKDLARLISQEHGKPLQDAIGGVERGIEA